MSRVWVWLVIVRSGGSMPRAVGGGPDGIAAAAVTLTVAGEIGIRGRESMASYACRLGGIRCGARLAAQKIGSSRDGLEVPRIDTPTVSAEMVELKPHGDSSSVQFIRDAMGHQLRRTLPASAHHAVAAASATRPDPAGRSLPNARPETLGHGLHQIGGYAT